MPAVPSNKSYRVGRSRTGLGLFATKPIKKGARIIRYCGPVLDSRKNASPRRNRYLFAIDDRWTIDGSGRDNTARYINHSCEPNANAVVDPAKMTISIVARANIDPGDEITFHYGKGYFYTWITSARCRCDACEIRRRAEAEALKWEQPSPVYRNSIYHYTSTLYLPWIIASGELKPRPTKDVGIGKTRYLWASTNPQGDKTSSAMSSRPRPGTFEPADEWSVRLVRFTLPKAGFLTWSTIKRMHGWTKRQTTKLEMNDRAVYGEYGHNNWRLRRDPLPLTAVLKIEVQMPSGYWAPFKATKKSCFEISDDPPTMGICVDGFEFYSQAIGDSYYAPDRDEVAELYEEMSEG